MEGIMTLVFAESPDNAVKRLVDDGKLDRFFTDRVVEMIRHVTLGRVTPGYSPIGNVAISKDWPLKGTLRFTRAADNQRFKAYLTKGRNRRWKCDHA